jgi:hypothetical protein
MLVIPAFEAKTVFNMRFDELYVHGNPEDIQFFGFNIFKYIHRCIRMLQSTYNVVRLNDNDFDAVEKTMAVTTFLKYSDSIGVSVDLVPCIKCRSEYLHKIPPLQNRFLRMIENIFKKEQLSSAPLFNIEKIDYNKRRILEIYEEKDKSKNIVENRGFTCINTQIQSRISKIH